MATPPENEDVPEIAGEELDDRRLRGAELYEAALRGDIIRQVINDSQTIYWSDRSRNTAYIIERTIRNIRGSRTTEYRCSCPDCLKQARRDCAYRFCEKLFQGDAKIKGDVPRNRAVKKAGRRPARKRYAADGRAIKTAQRAARVKMPTEIPRLIVSLRDAYDHRHRDALSLQHGKLTADSLRAAILLLKISQGVSSDAMIEHYRRHIGDGLLQIERPPHQNTLSGWINDPALTPVLHEMLAISSEPCRIREIGVAIDSSKVSQLAVAHARLVDYGTDERPDAIWMKAHTVMGVETMIILGAEFSESGPHDSRFLKPLMEKLPPGFSIKFLLADKAYLSEDILGWLWERGIKAVIPVKAKWDPKTKHLYPEAARHLVEWYDGRPRDFDEVYRLRPKIEGLFSLFKRLADGYCWSRGRRRENKATTVAWENEVLCKFIYMNLRTITTLSEETGYRNIEFRQRERFFPEPDEPLLRKPI